MGFWDKLKTALGRYGDTDAGRPVDVAADLARTVAAVQSKLDYVFENPELLARALVHRSHTHAHGVDRIESNERLEFLGDSVLGLVVNTYLYRHYSDREEGDLTKMKSKLVCGESLSRVAMRVSLGDHILMSRGEASTGGRRRASILADAVEAVLGAVYLDGGLVAATGVVERWLLDDADAMITQGSLSNDKSRLQETIQARHKSPPVYRLVEATGPDHARNFVVEVLFAGTVLGHGSGPSKKRAEQAAARVALRRLTEDPALLDDDEA